LNTALAAASALIAVAFGLSTWDRWLRRHRPHELAWTIAMALFALAAFSLWWGEARGWSEPSFRIFFMLGAVLNVPWLALGRASRWPCHHQNLACLQRVLSRRHPHSAHAWHHLAK
jgi:hypothetical protein